MQSDNDKLQSLCNEKGTWAMHSLREDGFLQTSRNYKFESLVDRAAYVAAKTEAKRC